MLISENIQCDVHKKLGGAYCFDEEAYGHFLPPAQAAGLPLVEEDFSDPGPTGIHLVRVGLI